MKLFRIYYRTTLDGAKDPQTESLVVLADCIQQAKFATDQFLVRYNACHEDKIGQPGVRFYNCMLGNLNVADAVPAESEVVYEVFYKPLSKAQKASMCIDISLKPIN